MRKITVVAFSICLICMIIAAFPRYSIADTIYGCYDQITGLLRIVASSDPANCTGCETLISWNSVGPAGTVATVSVGTVTTGAPGTPAAVTNTGTSSAAVLNFTIPQGATGTDATVSVGTVTTGTPGTLATVTNSGTSPSAAVLNFTIPQGATGATGPTGPTGPQGPAGMVEPGQLYNVLCDNTTSNTSTTLGCNCWQNPQYTYPYTYTLATTGITPTGNDIVINYGVDCQNLSSVSTSYVVGGYPSGVVAVCTNSTQQTTPVRIHLWCLSIPATM